MTDTKKSINKLVSAKMKNRADRLAEASKQGDNEETANIIADYRLYFEGAREALKAAGIADGDSKAFELAHEANETEMKLLEQRFHLEEMLAEEE